MTVWLFRMLALAALVAGLAGLKPVQPVSAECTTGSSTVCPH